MYNENIGMHIKSIGTKTIIKLDSWRDKTASGLYLHDRSQTTPVTGEIVAIGSRCVRSISVGDRVLVERYQGTIFWHNNDDVKLLSVEENAIIGVISKDCYIDYTGWSLKQ